MSGRAIALTQEPQSITLTRNPSMGRNPYEAPRIKRQERMAFTTTALPGCRQCSSCHGCR
jgi:hypothetical protein